MCLVGGVLSLLFTLVLLLYKYSKGSGGGNENRGCIFPPSSTFSTRVATGRNSFAFSKLLAFSSRDNLALDCSRPSSVTNVAISLGSSATAIAYPRVRPIVISLPSSSTLYFAGGIFSTLGGNRYSNCTFNNEVVGRNALNNASFQIAESGTARGVVSIRSDTCNVCVRFGCAT